MRKDDNILYWVWLAEKCGAASKQFRKLADKYEDPFDIYMLEVEEIERLEGISGKLKNALADKSLEASYAVLRYCRSNKVDIISYADERYPSRLKTIEDPPVLFYCMGELPNMNDSLCISIVGTRKISEYGRQSAYKIAYELAGAGAVVVSGMALGVDGVAACGAIAGGGKTVAVLGSGISVVYPKEHTKLMKEIAKHGAVITEYSPYERPNGDNFPKRNRLISGLSQGVVVVEGVLRSGALITASHAISQGRVLFALPGKINESNSNGPNKLIKEGANVTLCAEDIVTHFDFLYHDVIDYKGLATAKRSSELSESEIRRMGVSSVYYRGRFDADDESGLVEVKPSRKKPKDNKKGSAATPQTVSDKSQKESGEQIVVDDSKLAIIDGLDDVCKKVYEAAPKRKGEKFNADHSAFSGMDIADLMTAFTMLEISGLIETLPGGSYICK